MFFISLRDYPKISARIRVIGVAMMQSARMIALSRVPVLTPASFSSFLILFILIDCATAAARCGERCFVVKVRRCAY